MAGGKCNRCGTSNTKFKFFNNKKPDQPRYQCLSCTSVTGKPYFFNPNPKRQHHKDGYAKQPKEETAELKNLVKVCDKCQAVNNVKFRGYNNGNMNQPRYVCRGCNKLFSPLKKSKAIDVRAVVDTTEPSNQFQTQAATTTTTTSEAVHQEPIPLQHQVTPYGFYPTNLQTPEQNHNNYQKAILQQQQIALENQQSHFPAQNHYYHPNPTPSSQQHIPIGIPLPQFTPSFQNNYTQHQFAPRFQQPQYPALVHNSNQCNPRNFPQQQIRTESPQPYYQPSFQNDLRQRTTMFQQQQFAPRNQQLHHQSRIPQNYQCNPQQQFPTGIQQRHPHPSFQIIQIVIPSENQQHPLQPASQSNNNHPGARNSEELGVGNEQDPATASLAATRSSATASPLAHQSITEHVPEEVSNILEEPYFKDMMGFGKRESIKS